MQTATLKQMQSADVRPLPLTDKLARFVGRLPANAQWTIAITGKPGGGKSTFVLQRLVPELVRFGRVLYFTSEEDLFQGTISERAVRGGVVHHPRLKFAASDSLEDLKNELQTGNYYYCIIDSVNEFMDADGKEVPAKRINQLGKEFPGTSFVFIGQMEATFRRFAGGAKTAYRGDVVIRCEERADGASMAYLEKYRYGSVDMEYMIMPPKTKAGKEKPKPLSIKEMLRKIAQ